MDLQVNNAVNLLLRIGALDKQEELTALGTLLSRMPLHPQVSCIILVFGGKSLGQQRFRLESFC